MCIICQEKHFPYWLRNLEERGGSIMIFFSFLGLSKTRACDIFRTCCMQGKYGKSLKAICEGITGLYVAWGYPGRCYKGTCKSDSHVSCKVRHLKSQGLANLLSSKLFSLNYICSKYFALRRLFACELPCCCSQNKTLQILNTSQSC